MLSSSSSRQTRVRSSACIRTDRSSKRRVWMCRDVRGASCLCMHVLPECHPYIYTDGCPGVFHSPPLPKSPGELEERKSGPSQSLTVKCMCTYSGESITCIPVDTSLPWLVLSYAFFFFFFRFWFCFSPGGTCGDGFPAFLSCRNKYLSLVQEVLRVYPNMRFQDCYVDGNAWNKGPF